MQTNVIFDRDEDSVTLTCPQCGSTVEMNEVDFYFANKSEQGFTCSGCKCVYYVGTTLLDPRGLTLREPVAPIREALCDCKTHHNFQEVAINHCFDCNKPLHS